jgi:4-hydroxybenzoate polyprenyltransferase
MMHTNDSRTKLQSNQRTNGAALPSGRRPWPAERVLFALAGSMTLLSVLLAVLVSPWFLLLTAFVGVNQWLYVVVHACPASVVLSRVGLHRTCEW